MFCEHTNRSLGFRTRYSLNVSHGRAQLHEKRRVCAKRNINSSSAIIDPETSYDRILIPIKYEIVQLLCLSRVFLVEIAPCALKQNTARERCQSPWKRHTRDL
jgi:hypothetical protein